MTHARRLGHSLILATALAALAAGPSMAGGGRHSMGGSGYGVQGGVNDNLALSNVYSGIYGAQYTFDRAHYDFNHCPPFPTAGSQWYTEPDCRR